MRILWLLIAIIFSGCSASWHLKKAIQKGALLKSDTVYVEKSVIIPEVTTDTVFHSVAGDTVRIEKERLKIKYVRLPGDSVYIEGKCESDTVKIIVPVKVETQIKAPPPKMTVWKAVLYSISALVIGIIIGVLLAKIFL